MANVATMGPPPSPKEPRRSGRRPAPSASTSKSPAGSPTSDLPPTKTKESNHKHTGSLSSHPNRHKRTKVDDADDVPEDHTKAPPHSTTNGRTKRRTKEKDKPHLEIDIPTRDDASVVEGGAESGVDPPEDEETGVTRCICEETGEDEASEFMAMCEICHTWQHGHCMGYASVEEIPLHYFCEQCKPDMYPGLQKKPSKRARQSSAASHHTTAAANSRSSRSHSPSHLLKPTKRRNTMNSRDAAYEETFQATLQVSAAEAAAASEPTVHPGDGDSASVNGKTESEHNAETGHGGRKKRKRVEDDSASTKRNRSPSILSDHTTTTTAHAQARDPTPVNNAKPLPVPAPKPRAKRGGRKAQVQEMDADETGSTTSTRRQANNRSKGNNNHEHGSRRGQANGVNGHGPNSAGHGTASASTRAYHNSHVYAMSQQPLFTSWNLPDYLSHLEPMLPSNIPRPLELRGFIIGASGHEVSDRTTERGVKVKWPSKRMSMGDMNKRVRALVEWVGREQASAAERCRRKEAIEKAMKETQPPRQEGEVDGVEARDDAAMTVDEGALTESPAQEPPTPIPNGKSASTVAPEGLGSDYGISTMKMMEGLMEELINFQERFGPGAKVKERERRVVSS